MVEVRRGWSEEGDNGEHGSGVEMSRVGLSDLLGYLGSFDSRSSLLLRCGRGYWVMLMYFHSFSS